MRKYTFTKTMSLQFALGDLLAAYGAQKEKKEHEKEKAATGRNKTSTRYAGMTAEAEIWTGVIHSPANMPSQAAVVHARDEFEMNQLPALARDVGKYCGPNGPRDETGAEAEASAGVCSPAKACSADREVAVSRKLSDVLLGFMRVQAGLVVAGATRVPEDYGNPAENAWGVVFGEGQVKIHLYYTATEQQRFMMQFIAWSGSFDGARLLEINLILQERAQVVMTQSRKYYASAIVDSMLSFNPSYMLRPSAGLSEAIVAVEDESEGKKKRAAPEGERGDRWAELMSSRDHATCFEFQKGICRGGCGRPHRCEWCGKAAHGGRTCPSKKARKYRGEMEL